MPLLKDLCQSPGTIDWKGTTVVQQCRQYIDQFMPLQKLLSDVQKERDHLASHGAARTPGVMDILVDALPAKFRDLTERYIEPVLYQEALQWIRPQIAGRQLFVALSTS